MPVVRSRWLGTGSVHASLISGGTELSTYPDLCRVHIERRTVPGETPSGVEAEFRQIIAAGAAQDSTFRADLTMGISRDPFHVSDSQPIVRLLSEVATTHLGRVPATIGAGGWMDSALLSAAGIPTVIFGPTGAGAHADVEWVDLDSAATCATHPDGGDDGVLWVGSRIKSTSRPGPRGFRPGGLPPRRRRKTARG